VCQFRREVKKAVQTPPSSPTTATPHLVKTTANVNGAALYDRVDRFRDGGLELGVGKLGMEEDLRAQKALVAHVDGDGLLGAAVDDLVLLDPHAGV
jgi:hypothetical protein